MIPPPHTPGHYYTPYEAITYIEKLANNKNRYICDLQSNGDTGQLQTKRVSENLVITLMIMKNYLPVNKTTMYSIVNQFRNQGIIKFKYWRQRNKSGPNLC